LWGLRSEIWREGVPLTETDHLVDVGRAKYRALAEGDGDEANTLRKETLAVRKGKLRMDTVRGWLRRITWPGGASSSTESSNPDALNTSRFSDTTISSAGSSSILFGTT